MSVMERSKIVGLALVALLNSSRLFVFFAGGSAVAAGMTMSDQDMQRMSPSAKSTSRLPPGYTDIRIPAEVRQRIGVQLGRVVKAPLSMTIRAVGIVQPNETRVQHIHLKTDGWIEKLYVDFTGQKVKAGDPLLSIYSPSFLAAQGELLAALQSARSSPSADRQLVVESARRRLLLWDIPRDQIDKLEKTGRPIEFLTLRSPISGTVLEKRAFEGQYVMPASDLFVVADLSTVWMQAKIYEYEQPHIEVGMPASLSFPTLMGRFLSGRIMFIDPVVDEVTRTVRVRVELPNPDGQIRPGMFGDVLIHHPMGTGLTVPTSAVIRSGEQDIVFRAESGDRFVPVQVKISPLRFDDHFQILDGLQAGDEVAISGNYLIDSESRLEAGAGSMAGMAGMRGGSNKPGAQPNEDRSGAPVGTGRRTGSGH